MQIATFPVTVESERAEQMRDYHKLMFLGSITLISGCNPVVAPVAETAAPAASTALANWFEGYLLGKAADGIWDSVTGKPDVRELQERLDAFQADLARTDSRCADEIKRLRLKIDRNTTEEQYRELAIGTARRLEKLELRVDDLARILDDVKKFVAQESIAGGDLSFCVLSLKTDGLRTEAARGRTTEGWLVATAVYVDFGEKSFGKSVVAPYRAVYGSSSLTFTVKKGPSLWVHTGGGMAFEERIACIAHLDICVLKVTPAGAESLERGGCKAISPVRASTDLENRKFDTFGQPRIGDTSFVNYHAEGTIIDTEERLWPRFLEAVNVEVLKSKPRLEAAMRKLRILLLDSERLGPGYGGVPVIIRKPYSRPELAGIILGGRPTEKQAFAVRTQDIIEALSKDPVYVTMNDVTTWPESAFH